MKQPINAVEAGTTVFGSRAALAARLGVSRQTLNSWRRRGVPAERALDFAKVTGLPRSIVRPDIYPADQEPQSQETVTAR